MFKSVNNIQKRVTERRDLSPGRTFQLSNKFTEYPFYNCLTTRITVGTV